MKNYSLMFFAILVFLCATNQHVMAQATGNNVPLFGKYLGFSGAQNLEFRTNNIIRMQLTQTNTSTINGFTVNNSGFLGLSANPTFFTTAQPFALLHLNGVNSLGAPQQNGYRTWMRHGIISTHNQDLMFIGQKANTDDVTDAVIGWADNGVGPDGPDNLVFIYTAGDGLGGAGDPQSLSDDGLELARMIPEGFTGIGTDWSNNVAPKRTLDVVFEDDEPQFRLTRTNSTLLTLGAYADFEVSTAGHLHILPRNGATRNVGIGYLSGAGTPTERLDVDGTARLRDMTENAGNVLITGVEETAAGDYALNYLSFSGNQNEYLAGDGTWQDVGSTLCEWNVNAGDLTMGYGGACNEGNVGIGLANPNAKLHVLRNETTAQNIGIKLDVNGGNTMEGLWVQSFPNGNTNVARGIRVEQVAQTSTSINYGINSRVSWGEKVVGVLGQASQGSVVNIGVGGLVVGGQSSSNHIGIYGEATIPGYFVGSIWTSAPTYNLSDENFKQNISEDMPGLETILELKPRTYEYRSEEFSFMNLPQGQQYGLIAQEVQETLPSLVKAGAKPEMTDPETGELISEGIEHLGVDYQSLIPILIKATQEQQELIDQQAAQINDLMDVVSACCSADTKSNETEDFNIFMDVKETALDQNYPNPFQRTTTISYTVGCACEAQVVILDQAGRIIETFNNGAKEAGDYQFQWDASNLESGIYFYSLIVDGQEYVKRALKL